MEDQHLCSRKHILLLKDSEINNDEFVCKLCDEYLMEPPYYVCDSCEYYVHKSCEELPKQINKYPLHPRHPLSLTTRYASCNCCGQASEKRLVFSCDGCDFDLDVECFKMSNSITACPEGQHCIQHSSHPHLLLLVDTTNAIHEDEDIDVRCFACQSKSSPSESDGGVYYGCNRCKYFLHKQCIDQLPQEIQTSHHPNHDRLFLHMKRYNCKCSTCGNKDQPALYFECPQCDFRLCLECGVRRTRTIKYEDHPHLLCFMKKINNVVEQCNVYDTCLKQSIMCNTEEFHKTDSFKFQCLDCDFKLHLLCGPLPSIIKHDSHMHSLDLVDSFIEDNSGEYCCDVCEEERNPRIRVYCCRKCKYIAHVHCVISEVINVLKEDLRDVKLKVLGEDLWEFPKIINHAAFPWTLSDLIQRLTYYELRWLTARFEGEEMSTTTTEVEPEDDNIDKVLKFSNFTETDFMSFIFQEFDSTYKKRKLKIKSIDLASKVVYIEGYFIPVYLASAMKALLHKYGDISTSGERYESKSLIVGDIRPSRGGYSQEWKSIGFFFVCKVMKEMHTTLVIDITKHLLQQWYHYITFVEDWLEFKVGFLKSSLRKITRDFYYQQLSKVVDKEFRMKIEKKKAELQKKIAELQKKMAEYDAELVKSKSSTTEEQVKEGLEMAMNVKWKVASQVGFN
ncbi:uncharacterized protein LOC133783824 [Humulus lupulus]|uniref:uncharacterized protein LOC133783824 n=1 Tax=Humulus lupulus TaxID=3486 RepID=UPI002B404876|nr:uncharacterized protein LOC133783824 [Humulus lupulus]XP_062079427.1 uncharacterized protein LOC133783824 [Humulus lupulus]